MKVYIAERGVYEDRHIVGIYDSPERAMAALPDGVWTKTTNADYPDWPDRRRVNHWALWDNGLDWDNAATVTESEFITEGPTRSVDRSLLQTYRKSDGGWDYVPESEEDGDGFDGYNA